MTDDATAAPGGDDGEENLPAKAGEDRLASPIARRGMFGTRTTGDTSGYGGLLVRRPAVPDAVRPYTDPDDPRTADFDTVADALESALADAPVSYADAVERVAVDHGEITFQVRREALPEVMRRLRDDPRLRFELCLGVSGVHYPETPAASCTPSTKCVRSPTTPRSASRPPAPTPTRTSPRSWPPTRPTTGTSARRGTSSGSSSTATPR